VGTKSEFMPGAGMLQPRCGLGWFLFLAAFLVGACGLAEEPGRTECGQHADCASGSGNSFCKLEQCGHPLGLQYLCGR
jgi:hypothetical protein